MISRLVLNLRSVPQATVTEYHSGSSGAHRGILDQSFMTRTIGNLGGDIFVSGQSTVVSTLGPGEDKLGSEIPLANVSSRSEFSQGNIQWSLYNLLPVEIQTVNDIFLSLLLSLPYPFRLILHMILIRWRLYFRTVVSCISVCYSTTEVICINCCTLYVKYWLFVS